MRSPFLIVVGLILPVAVPAQSSSTRNPPDGVILEFARIADIFGSRLVTAFDSIPAARYNFHPTPTQQTVGYIAQHLENANYGLCERMGGARHPRTAKDSLADTVKANWPKDTLVARLVASLRFCDDALERLEKLDTPALTSTLLAFETDLAEHYSQIATYMRILGLVPPSALPPVARKAIELPPSALSALIGVYQLGTGVELDVTARDGALFVKSSSSPNVVRLWAESANEFFVKEAEAQISFTRNPSGAVSGLVLHQYGRDRPARKIR